MTELVLATGNLGKVRELHALLEPMGVTVLSQSAFQVAPVDEDGLSFVENALKKARHCAKHSGRWSLADDSGLVVDALHGAPGIHSARYAGDGASDADNIVKLLHALRDVPTARRSAHFHCTMVLVRNEFDPDPIICQGRWAGRITQAPIGQHGFGYDPVFFVEDTQCCAAELSAADKNARSHRGQAMRALMQQLTPLLMPHDG